MNEINDGLEPHLEAMMWEVFKKIQIRANGDSLLLLSDKDHPVNTTKKETTKLQLKRKIDI